MGSGGRGGAVGLSLFGIGGGGGGGGAWLFLSKIVEKEGGGARLVIFGIDEKEVEGGFGDEGRMGGIFMWEVEDFP